MTWIKSSFCNGAASCLEVAWVRASRCDTGNCVEVHLHADAEQVWVRDSKLGDASPVLRVPVADWQAFLDAVKYGLLGDPGGLVMCRRVGENAWNVWLSSDVEVALDFTEREVSAFWVGVQADEFDVATLSAGDGSDGDGPARGAETAQAASGGGSVPA